MGKIKKYIFKKKSIYMPNVFIGGVGASYITSANDYASISNLTESQIKNFQIDVNNNISFYTNTEHTINDGASTTFNTPELTYFIDLGGKIIACEGLNGIPNCLCLYFPSLVSSDQINVRDSVVLTGLTIGDTDMNDRLMYDTFPSLKHFYFNTLTSISSSVNSSNLNEYTNIERLYIGNLENINPLLAYGVMRRNSVRGYTLRGINPSAKIYYNPLLGVANREAFLNFNELSIFEGDTYTINGLVYTCVNGIPSADGEFQINVDANTVKNNLRAAINSDTRIGTFDKVLATNDNASLAVYSSVIGAGGNSVEVVAGAGNIGLFAPELPNLRGGYDVHPALIIARELGCTLIEVTDTTKPNQITDLSFSNITSSSVDVSFTPPISTNNLDFYEVYIERQDLDYWHEIRVQQRNTIHQEIIGSGDTINNLLANVDYKIKIVACDEFWNKSEISNEIEITTL